MQIKKRKKKKIAKEIWRKSSEKWREYSGDGELFGLVGRLPAARISML